LGVVYAQRSMNMPEAKAKEKEEEICWECGEIAASYESYYGLLFCENCVTI